MLVDRPAEGLDADVVGIDDQRAAFDAVSHLIAHGHRDIAYVGDYSQVATSAARLAGYRQAMAQHGLDVRDRLVHADCPTAHGRVRRDERPADRDPPADCGVQRRDPLLAGRGPGPARAPAY